MAAEIAAQTSGPNQGEHRFNEAAANGRGNRRSTVHRSPARTPASMRPRRMAAEIHGRGGRVTLAPVGFNEAAANGRGNPKAQVGAPS